MCLCSLFLQLTASRKIIAFGGNGFIGTACINRLINSGDEIVVVSRGNWYFDSDKIIKPNVKQIKCNRKEDLSKFVLIISYHLRCYDLVYSFKNNLFFFFLDAATY